MSEELNQNTQEQIKHPIFNNWEVIPKGWYFFCKSKELKKNKVKNLIIGKQKVVVFRSATNKVVALDAFCSHMGADLSIGKVKGENLQCFFHHWEYNNEGKCSNIPCGESIPDRAKVSSYQTCEKYGAIWIYPEQTSETRILEVPALEGFETISAIGAPNYSKSHHHISMINGIDPQHLQTVHKLSIEMDLKVLEDSTQIEFILEGPTPKNSLMEKIIFLLIGKRYSYSMKYADACLASLTLMRNTYFLKEKWKWPELHMFYAYRPGPDNSSLTFPIYVTKKENSILGRIKASVLLFVTKKMYLFLKDEDDIIYENIRFNTKNLLRIDSPVTRYIAYVNRLRPSKWSQKDLVKEKASQKEKSPINLHKKSENEFLV